MIWVLDLGRQVFEDGEATLRYLRVQELVTCIKALYLFEDRRRAEKIGWLESRAVFVVLDTRFEQAIDMKGFPRPSFIAHHVSFSAIPPEWAKSSNFRALYGSQLEQLNQRTFSVFSERQGRLAIGR